MLPQRLLSIACILLFGGYAALGHGGHDHSHTHHRATEQDLAAEEIVYCNATKIGEKDMAAANKVFSEWMANDGARKLQSGTPARVPVYVHIITSSDGLEGSVTPSTISDQIDVLNESFQPYFTFELVETETVANDAWFFGGLSFQSTNTARTTMKRSLRKGGPASLNIYTTETTRSSGGVLLGLATFPSEYRTAPDEDGIVVWYATLPGGMCGILCNQGYTTVHEVGHWLGLYHTFHALRFDGCLEGDDVDDTPRQATPTSGCPIFTPDTCPLFTGRDPVENFMDYSSDTCKDAANGDGFSPGQIQRMRAFWDTYRADDVVVPGSAPAEMTPPSVSSETVDVYIEFQYDRFPSETSWQIVNSAGDAVLDYPRGSASGLLSGVLPFPPDTYRVIIQDTAGDGTCCDYGFGYVLVSVNGGPPTGGFGRFQFFASLTFTVVPVSGASFAGGEPMDTNFQVPDGSESSMVADDETDAVGTVSGVGSKLFVFGVLFASMMAAFVVA